MRTPGDSVDGTGGRASSADGTSGSDTRQAICRAASRLFRQRGFAATTVAAIAREVGITPGALYWHFASKEEILATVLEETIADFERQVTAAATGATVAERLYNALRTHVLLQLAERSEDAPASATLVIAQLASALPAERQERIRAVERAYYEFLCGLLTEGAASGELDVGPLAPTVFSLVNLADYVITWYRDEGPLGPEEVADAVARLGLRMVGARDLPAPSAASSPTATGASLEEARP